MNCPSKHPLYPYYLCIGELGHEGHCVYEPDLFRFLEYLQGALHRYTKDDLINLCKRIIAKQSLTKEGKLG